MKRAQLLLADAIVNLALGALLLLVVPFPAQLPQLLGVPPVTGAFYPSILGGVLFGIGIALLLERSRKDTDGLVGLGLGGAIAINLSGGIVLGGWLLLGNLDLPPRGRVFLSALAVMLVAISAAELVAHAQARR